MGAASGEGDRAEVLSVISHDIRAPLGVILVAVSELQDPKLGPLTDDQRTLLQLVRRASEKLSRLASNVLYLNRIALGNIALSRVRADLRELASRALQSFERSGEIGKLRVALDLPDARLDVDADTDAVVHAISNLLANAIRFARSQVSVVVSADPAGPGILVADDGPGIPEDALPFLFGPAVRVRSGGEPLARGLGLVVARGIVEAHGGHVVAEVCGEGGQPAGAAVRIRLPRPQL